MGSSSFLWREGDSGPQPLIAACVYETRDRLDAAGSPTSFEELAVDIDTSDFFRADGSKRGFGSSAAVAVGLVAALLRAGGLEDRSLEEAIFPVALAAHRRAQGGRGSGYDVAASRFGGLGLFTGGALPTWTDLPGLELPGLRHFPGAAAVSSAVSVSRYENWGSSHEEERARFVADSRCVVDAFVAGPDSAARIEAIGRAAALGIELGDAIGVEARLATPLALPAGAAIKALGAGNELGLLASIETKTEGPSGADAAGLVWIQPDWEGLKWD
jgi:phosphomevalonate kinase